MGILEDGAETWLETVLDKIDYYIIGEGELALENLLRGNTKFKGINGRVDQITDLSSLGPATYDDYDHEEHDDLNIYFDRGRNVLACNILNKIKQYEKMEDYTK